MVDRLESHVRLGPGQTVGMVGPKPIRASLAPGGSPFGRPRFSHCSASGDASIPSRLHSSTVGTP